MKTVLATKADAAPDPEGDFGWIEIARSIIDFLGSKLAFVVLVIAISSILEAVGLLMMLPVLDIIFSQENSESIFSAFFLKAFLILGIDSTFEQLLLFTFLFLALMMVRAYVLFHRDVMMTRLSLGFVDHVRSRFFGALTRADWPALKRIQKSNLLDSMTINIGRVSAAVVFLSRGTVTLILLIVYIASAFIVDPWIGIILLLIAVIGTCCSWLWIRSSQKLGTDMTVGNRKVMQETTRFLEGLKAAKTCHAEDEFMSQFRKSIAYTRTVSTKFAEQQGKMRRTVDMIGAFAAMGLLLIGYGLLGLSGPELLVMGAIIIRLMPNLISLLGGLQTVAFALPAFRSIEDLRHSLEIKKQLNIEADCTRDTNQTYQRGGIHLKDVSVSVRDNGADVTLIQIDDLEIVELGLVYVHGPSGGGKSTFVELLAGLYQQSSGTIRRNDILLQADQMAIWQKHVSFAPQEPFLFDGTVRQNLCWPNAHATDDELWTILAAVQADELVAELPNGLDEELLDGGLRLSGGERQRLCLARALLRPSSLLILDEATSAVDSAIEDKILQHLAEVAQTKIILLVSHSDAARELAHQHIQVENGYVRSVEPTVGYRFRTV